MMRTAPLLHLLHLLLLFLLLSAAEASVLCSWTGVTSNQEEVQRSFVRSGARPPRLFHAVWSSERALLGCTWSDDTLLVRAYLRLCLERPQEFKDQPEGPVEALLQQEEEEERCVPLGSPTERRRRRGGGQGEGSEVMVRSRVRRGFIVPGTLWCGSGNKAPSYSNLGVFSHTDSCCREHDQCTDNIPSFHSKFGVFNTNIFTLSHCDCDHKFRRCLTEAGDRISDVVGYTFFNLLKMPCFQFAHRLQCTQRNWFGLCKETKMARYAQVFPPTMYQSANTTEDGVNGTHATNTTTTAPEPPTGTQTDMKELQASCGVFRDLDECTDVILPQQSRYGLPNPDLRTLYHCNCTSRLFQTASRPSDLTRVQQAVLLGHVVPSCFLLQDCTAGGTCSALLLKATLPELAEERRPLAAAGPKLRRPNPDRVKRKDRTARLRRLCVRLARHKAHTLKDTHTHTQEASWWGTEPQNQLTQSA